jgi:hypothetical protein
MKMIHHKEKCDLLYAITLEGHLKYACLNNVNVTTDIVLGLFYNTYKLLCLCNVSEMEW